jgi:hypothetical protein
MLPKWDQLVLSRADSKAEFLAYLSGKYPGSRVVPDGRGGAFLEMPDGERRSLGIGGAARLAGGFESAGTVTAGSIAGGVALRAVAPEAGALGMIGASAIGVAAASAAEQAAENVGLRAAGIPRKPLARIGRAIGEGELSELTGRVIGGVGRGLAGGVGWARALTGGGEVKGGIPLPLPKRALERLNWYWEQFTGSTSELAKAAEIMRKYKVRAPARLVVPLLQKLGRLETLKEALIGIPHKERLAREEMVTSLSDILIGKRGMPPSLVAQVREDLMMPKNRLNVVQTGELIRHTANMYEPGVRIAPMPKEAPARIAKKIAAGRAKPVTPEAEPEGLPRTYAYDPLGKPVIMSEAYVMQQLRSMEPSDAVKWLLDGEHPERLDWYVKAVGREDASVKALGDAAFRQVMRGAVSLSVGRGVERLLSPRMLGHKMQEFSQDVQTQLAGFTASQKAHFWSPGFEQDIREFGDMLAYVFPRIMDRGMAGWKVGEVLDLGMKARYFELAKLYLADMTILSPQMITLLARGFRQPATRGQALNALRSVVTFATHQAISAVAGDDDPASWEEVVGADTHQPRENEMPPRGAELPREAQAR